jgi:broad specificity phosphatase PhoE
MRIPGSAGWGVAQSRLLGDRLRGEGAAVEVRHSPRRRAVETAAVLGEVCGTPTIADPLLDDRTPVPAPGEEALYPDWMRAWFGSVPEDERDEGGAQLSAAVELVTHAFVVGWFVQQILAGPVFAWTLIAAANAGLTTIDRRPGRPPQLAGVNDVGHLHPARPAIRPYAEANEQPRPR